MPQAHAVNGLFKLGLILVRIVFHSAPGIKQVDGSKTGGRREEEGEREKKEGGGGGGDLPFT